MNVFFFFFSSRRRHTRCSRDWSSDVCSSDLPGRSPAESTTPLKVGGTQKTLTRSEFAAPPVVLMGPAGMPVSVMVRASPKVNAPSCSCRHLMQDALVFAPPQPPLATVNAAQSASAVQGTAGFLMTDEGGALPQKPQKTWLWGPVGWMSMAVFTAVPV